MIFLGGGWKIVVVVCFIHSVIDIPMAEPPKMKMCPMNDFQIAQEFAVED